MRELTSAASAAKETLQRETPITIIKIEWSSGTVYYGDQDLTLGGVTIKGDIISFDPIAAQGKQSNISTISSATVTLDDTDGMLKTIVNTLAIEGTSVTVYQHFEGNALSDFTMILKGRVVSDIVWSEGQRTLQLGLETYIENNIVGYSTDEDTLASINPEAVNQPWPLGFGTVLKVPALQIYKKVNGKLYYGINHEFSQFKITNGASFPQGTEQTVKVGHVWYKGIFNEEVFTVTEANIAIDEDVAIDGRPIGDPNQFDASVAWLSDDTITLTNKYCVVNHPTYGDLVNYCVYQEGNKVFFGKPWKPDGTDLEILLGSTFTIYETAAIPRTRWGADYILEQRVSTNTQNVNLIPYYRGTIPTYRLFTVLRGQWSVVAGAPVTLVDTNDDTYIFNLLPSHEVLDVFGYRTYQGEKLFAPIPYSYYTKHLNGTIAGKACSYLTFDKPLTDRINEGWDGSVYVSYRSTVGSNGANVLKHLIEEYTNLTADTTTFNAVRPKLTSYWANFVVFDQPKALDLIEEVAWQLRCALLTDNGTARIKYLSEIPTADDTIGKDNVVLKTLQLGFTPTESIQTRIIAKWRREYSGEPNTEYTMIYSNNEDAYGSIELEREFFISNVEEIISKTVHFWGYRYSNIWRGCSYKTLLNALDLEVFDTVNNTIDTLSTNSIRGIINSLAHDSVSNTVDLELELASKAGSSTLGQPVEDTYYWCGDPSDPVCTPLSGITDPGAGLQEVDYVVPVFNQGGTVVPPVVTNGATTKYYIRFTSYPDEIQRGVNFALAAQLEAYDGTLIVEDFSATISMVSTDGSDSLNKGNISFTNGTWSASDCQITSGSGSDSTIFTIAGGGYEPGSTPAISVIEQRVGALTITTSPSSVTRGTDFSFAVSGGVLDDSLTVTLNSSDGNDRLYDASGPVTTITLDVAGTFSASDWYISGGTEEDTGTITLTSVYSPVTSDSFSLTGGSPLLIEQTMSMEDEFILQAGYLELTGPASIEEDTDFELSATVNRSSGNVNTNWDDYLQLVAIDSEGDPVNWASCGTGDITNNQAVVEMVDGEWSATDCQLDLSTAVGAVTITAGTPYPYVELEDEITVAVGVSFVFTVSPVGTQRGSNFTLTVEIQDGAGAVQTTMAPDCTLTLGGADPSDVLNDVSISSGEWSNGVWTSSTMQITGGTGSEEDVTITISDDAGAIGDGVADLVIYLSSTNVAYNSDKRRFYGYHSDDTNDDTWENIQNTAIAVLQTASYTTITTATNDIAVYSDGWYHWSLWSPDTSWSATKYVQIHNYTIPDLTGKLTTRLTVTGYGRVGGVDYVQPDITVYASGTQPASYAELLSLGIALGIVPCDTVAGESRSFELSIDYLESISGGTLYIWGIPNTWYIDDSADSSNGRGYIEISPLSLLS